MVDFARSMQPVKVLKPDQGFSAIAVRNAVEPLGIEIAAGGQHLVDDRIERRPLRTGTARPTFGPGTWTFRERGDDFLTGELVGRIFV